MCAPQDEKAGVRRVEKIRRAAGHDSVPGIWASGAQQSHPTYGFSSGATTYRVISEREGAGAFSTLLTSHPVRSFKSSRVCCLKRKAPADPPDAVAPGSFRQNLGKFQDRTGKPECCCRHLSHAGPRVNLHRMNVHSDESTGDVFFYQPEILKKIVCIVDLTTPQSNQHRQCCPAQREIHVRA